MTHPGGCSPVANRAHTISCPDALPEADCRPRYQEAAFYYNFLIIQSRNCTGPISGPGAAQDEGKSLLLKMTFSSRSSEFWIWATIAFSAAAGSLPLMARTISSCSGPMTMGAFLASRYWARVILSRMFERILI